jgi:glycogen synthase
VPVDRFTSKYKSSFIVSPKGKCQVFLLENDEFFGKDSPYLDPKTGKDYANNDERFIFFNRAIVQVLGLLGWQPDIIHCNDWQTGLIPAYIKTIYSKDPLLQSVKHCLQFTISHSRACLAMIRFKKRTARKVSTTKTVLNITTNSASLNGSYVF